VERVAPSAAAGDRVSERPQGPLELQERAGQPWVMISGVAAGSGERTCSKCTRRPSMVVVNCGIALSRACVARQS
jgi:hypothetical protein